MLPYEIRRTKVGKADIILSKQNKLKPVVNKKIIWLSLLSKRYRNKLMTTINLFITKVTVMILFLLKVDNAGKP